MTSPPRSTSATIPRQSVLVWEGGRAAHSAHPSGSLWECQSGICIGKKEENVAFCLIEALLTSQVLWGGFFPQSKAEQIFA